MSAGGMLGDLSKQLTALSWIYSPVLHCILACTSVLLGVGAGMSVAPASPCLGAGANIECWLTVALQDIAHPGREGYTLFDSFFISILALVAMCGMVAVTAWAG